MKKLWLMCMLISSAINAQTFDFSCTPTLELSNNDIRWNSIITDFIRDSGRKDLTPDMFYGVIATRDDIRRDIRSNLPDPYVFNIIAFAYRYCGNRTLEVGPARVDVPKRHFIYVKESWDIQDPAFRKRVVYHELGHSVYQYDHPNGDGFTGYTFADIMGNVSALIATHVDWANAVTRFFAGTNHTRTYQTRVDGELITREFNCAPARGNGEVIIIDN